MRVAITGGTGFLGTNLALAHVERGDEVWALDNFFKSAGAMENRQLLESKGVRIEALDIREREDVDHFFQHTEVDVVHHCAAQVAFKRSVERPRLDFEINALGTFNLLEALRAFRPEARFVCTSTNQVYGPMDDLARAETETRHVWTAEPYKTHGVPETKTLDFLSPYGCSKGAADQYTLDYARVFGLSAVAVRLSGIFGIHQYSYEDHGWVAYMTKMVKANLPFNRFGNGKQVRDILYIDDIVRFYLIAADRAADPRIKGQAFNVGGGPRNSFSVLELLKLLERLTGNKERSTVHPPRAADKLIYISDIRKAKELLGWEPVIEPEEGLRRLIAWSGA